MLRKKIQEVLGAAIKSAQTAGEIIFFETPDIKVGKPPEGVEGDYATNIAMAISKIIKEPADKVAEIVVKHLLKNKEKETWVFEEGPVVKKPGFINFFVSKEYLQKQIPEILEKGENYGQLEIGKNKKVQVEFISANPTGPLTVGNARGGVFGDTLANVLKKAGFKTEKAYYINDYGMQVLTLGHSVLKDAEAKYKGDYIDKLHERIKETDPYKAGQEAAKIIVEEMIKKTTDKAGIKYDEWFSESELYNKKEVNKVLSQLEKKGLTHEKEGALWFKSTAFGDKRDRVVIKSDGWKTYLAGDIAYHKYKFENKKFDKVINIWGADHLDDEPGLQAGVEARA